jgi:hypothetical protein
MIIFERMRAGGIIPNSDPQWSDFWAIVNQTIALAAKFIRPIN